MQINAAQICEMEETQVRYSPGGFMEEVISPLDQERQVASKQVRRIEKTCPGRGGSGAEGGQIQTEGDIGARSLFHLSPPLGRTAAFLGYFIGSKGCW